MRRGISGAVVAMALMLATAACAGSGGGGGDESTPAAGDGLSGRGPITFVAGKDRSGNMRKQMDAWNADHPDERVRLIELADEPNQQRQQMIQNAQTKSGAYTVLNLDVVWTAEFAANRWLVELPRDEFALSRMLPATVTTGEYRGGLYAVPSTSDSGLLFYREDLLKAAGVSGPPTTWDEMWAACDKVLKLPEADGMNCYLTEVAKTEGLTVTTAEAINSAGGDIVDESGMPHVDTPEAARGLNFLVEAYQSGRMPKSAITLDGEGGRRMFQDGELVFHRQWPYQYALANKTDGSSEVAGKFAVAPIPGLDGPGAANLGGHNLAISAFAENKATAIDFIKYLTGPEAQRANLLATSQAPTLAALYTDAEMVEKYPYLPTLKTAIENARSRPVVVRYGDVTQAIQEAAYGAISGEASADEALATLQADLKTLVNP